jgi:hypothetical protein
MSFADEEDVNDAIEAEVKPLTDEEKLFRCEETRRRLNSRCKGLLEIPMTDVWRAPPRSQDGKSSNQSSQRYDNGIGNSTTRKRTVNEAEAQDNFEDSESGEDQISKMRNQEKSDQCACSNQTEEYEAHGSSSSSEEDAGSISANLRDRLLYLDVENLGNVKIEYLHRTVKDYLEREEVWSQLLQATTRSFNAKLSLCRANLSLLKVQEPDKISEDTFWECVIDCLKYAGEAETNMMEPQVLLIDELGRVADIFDARGLELAEKARIVPISVDTTKPAPAMSISTRAKQEKVALGAVSWHEQFHRSRSTGQDKTTSLLSRSKGFYSGSTS